MASGFLQVSSSVSNPHEVDQPARKKSCPTWLCFVLAAILAAATIALFVIGSKHTESRIIPDNQAVGPVHTQLVTYLNSTGAMFYDFGIITAFLTVAIVFLGLTKRLGVYGA